MKHHQLTTIAAVLLVRCGPPKPPDISIQDDAKDGNIEEDRNFNRDVRPVGCTYTKIQAYLVRMIKYFEEEPLWVVLRAYDKMNRTAALGLHGNCGFA